MKDKIDVKTYGDYPTGDVLFASCDSKYFLDHGPAFMMSALKYKQNLHLHVVNPSKEAQDLRNKAVKFNNLTFTGEETDLKNIDARIIIIIVDNSL